MIQRVSGAPPPRARSRDHLASAGSTFPDDEDDDGNVDDDAFEEEDVSPTDEQKLQDEINFLWRPVEGGSPEPAPADAVVILDEVLPLSLKEIVERCFSSSSGFLIRDWEAQGMTDIMVSDWAEEEGIAVRTADFVKHIKGASMVRGSGYRAWRARMRSGVFRGTAGIGVGFVRV